MRRVKARAAPAALFRFLRRFETRALLLVFGIAATLWAFLAVADEVTEGETASLDRAVVLALRSAGDASDPIGPLTFEEAVRDITALGGTTVITLVTLVGLALFLFHGRLRHAAVLAGTVLLAWGSSHGLKALYGRPRPDLVPHGSNVYSASFPSGHSTLSAATFLILAALIASLEPERRTKALIYVLAIILMVGVGASRVYLGVHWPTDVLAGWCLGSACAFLGWIVLRRSGARTRG